MPGPESQRFIAGDPLRAVAALAVVVFHIALLGIGTGVARGEHAPFGQLTGTLASLQLGIYVFFALSGYLLARPFIVAFHNDERPPDVRRYFANRLLRIVPAFWVVAALTLVLLGTKGASGKQLALLFGFAQTYDESEASRQIVQAWTLGAEMLFYLLLPLVAVAMSATIGKLPRGRARLGAAAGLLGGALVLAYVYRVTGEGRLAQRPRPPAMLFAFAPGIALAAAEVLHLGRRIGRRRGSAVAWACLLTGLGLLVTRDHVRDLPAQVALATLGCGLVVAGPLVLQWTRGRAWPLLDNRVMQWLGERSYAIYLVHFQIVKQFADVYEHHGYWGAAGRVAVLAVPLTLVAAELLHRLVEVPFLRLRARWRRTPAQSVVAPAEA
jgi:peptidoglycan/LPS O-acetylase OafA/YrhL